MLYTAKFKTCLKIVETTSGRRRCHVNTNTWVYALNARVCTYTMEIAQEVEIRTQRRKRAVTQAVATQPKKSKPTTAKGNSKASGHKRKPKTTKLLTKSQRN